MRIIEYILACILLILGMAGYFSSSDGLDKLTGLAVSFGSLIFLHILDIKSVLEKNKKRC